MQTWLIDGATPLPMDPELEAVLTFGADAELDGGGIALNLGILDAAGEVYRVARSWNLTEYIVACKALERLGLSMAVRKPPVAGLSFEDVFVWAPALEPALVTAFVAPRQDVLMRP